MSSDRSRRDEAIPTLTDVVDLEPTALSPEERAAVQAEVTAQVLKLADQLLHEASREVETALFERVRDRLRARLPEIIDVALRERVSRN
ncbi:MAG TPA: hypothetical protein VIH25_03590 [Steroidobacteraceae bacterium]